MLHFMWVVTVCKTTRLGVSRIRMVHNIHIFIDYWSIDPDSQAIKVSNGAKIRNRYNQVPHLTQETNGKVTNPQLDTTIESQAVSPFPADDHNAHINRGAQRHSNARQKKNIKDPQTKYRLGTVSKIFYWIRYFCVGIVPSVHWILWNKENHLYT